MISIALILGAPVIEPPGNTASKTLPGAGGTQTILQLLGWDRVNEDQALSPDDEFDFMPNYTIDPGKGLLFFPYLEPYGNRLEQIIDAGGGSEAARQQLKDLLVFESLYREKKANARRDSQHDVYYMRGEYRGSVQSGYDLKAYAGVVEGSVRVTSGGTPLREGTDFVVEYSGNGYVEIINQAYLTSGRDIEIEFEQISFFNLRQKTLPGLRALYDNESILQFAIGKPSLAFGDRYRVFDEERVIARLPGPPYNMVALLDFDNAHAKGRIQNTIRLTGQIMRCTATSRGCAAKRGSQASGLGAGPRARVMSRPLPSRCQRNTPSMESAARAAITKGKGRQSSSKTTPSHGPAVQPAAPKNIREVSQRPRSALAI